MSRLIDASHVLVTGASSGIGWGFALACAPRARALTLVARRRDRLDALAEEIRESHPDCAVLVMPCDLSADGAIDEMIPRVEAAHGPIDILINNAGFGDVGYFDEVPMDKLARMIAVNVVAVTHLSHRVFSGMLSRKRGGILNVSSLAGLHAIPGYSVYTGTKHYVTAFTEALRVEAAGHGVHVTQLCPGPVATEFNEIARVPEERGAPSIIMVSVTRCVRLGLRGLERNRAVVVPGLMTTLAHWLMTWTPAPVLRVFWRLILVRLVGRRGASG